jgi:hypothetical protein
MPTGQKHTTVRWNDGGKYRQNNKLILTYRVCISLCRLQFVDIILFRFALLR